MTDTVTEETRMEFRDGEILLIMRRFYELRMYVHVRVILMEH